MKAMAAVMAFVAGEAMNVSQVCRECGISPKTFYKYAGAVSAGGFGRVRGRSRRPLTSRRRTPVDVEDAMVALRKELAEDGHDHGATTIQWHLGRDRRFGRAVPSVATVHRILGASRVRDAPAAQATARCRGAGSKRPLRTSGGRSTRRTG